MNSAVAQNETFHHDRMLENDAHYLETLARFDVTMPDSRAHKFKNIAGRLRDLAGEIKRAEAGEPPALVVEPAADSQTYQLSNVELQAAIAMAFDQTQRSSMSAAKDHYLALLTVQAARAQVTRAE